MTASQKMEEDPGILPERVLNLSIEIIALLSGETFPSATSGDLLKIMVPPFNFVISEETKRRIVDVANKIIELLTGQFSIRCQDVAVYLSMEEWDYLEGHMEFYKEVMTDNLQKKTMMEGLQKKTMMEDIQMEARQRKTMMEDLQNKTIMEDLQKKTVMAEQCLEEDKEAMMEDHKMNGSYTRDFEVNGTSLHVKNKGLTSEITLVKDEEVEIPVTVKEEERTLKVATDGSCSQDLKDHYFSQHVKDEGLEVEMSVVKDEEVDFPKTVKEEEIVLEVGKASLLVDFQSLYPQEDQEAEQKEARRDQQLSKEPGPNLRVKVKRVPLVTGEPDDQVEQIYNIQEALENSVILNIQPALPLANRAVEIPNTEESPACFEEPDPTKKSGLGNSMIFRSNVQDSGSSEEAASVEVEVEVTPTEGCSRQKTPSGSMVQITPKCEECGKTFSHKSSLVAHQKRHLIHPLTCFMCDKTFTHKSSLKAHERMHSGDLPYTCSECGKVFLKQAAWDIHQRRHRGEKPFACVDCGNRFVVKGDLISHRRVHTQERPYSCLVCSKSFGNTFNLRRHQRVHTGDKSYVCSTCGKSYAQKQDLLRHQKVHAGNAQAKALEAPSKRTLLPQNKQNSKQRIRPKKTHTCQVCQRSFGTSSNLSRHHRVHTGEKLFPCLTCGKRYSFKQHLLSHQKVHTDGSCSQDLKDHYSSQHVKDEGLEVEKAVVKDEEMDFPQTVKDEEIMLAVDKASLLVDLQSLYSQEDQEAEQKEARRDQQLSKELGPNLRVKVERVPLVTGEPDAQVGQIYNIQEGLENSFSLNIQPALPRANRAVEIPNTEESPACFEAPSSTKQSGLGDSTILHSVIGSEGGWAEDIEDPQRSDIEIESCSDSEAVKPMEDDVGETLPSEVSGSNVQDSSSSEEAASVEVEVEVTPTEGCSKQKTPSGSMVQITFKCEECGKTFSHKSSLVAHQKRHLIRPLTCSMCNKTFTHKNSLKAHERRHSGKLPYTCSECGKVFLKQGAWNIHQRRHRGEKPYVCVDCGNRFAVKGDLISHRRVHTQERPYSCLVCFKSFGNASNLRRHQNVHTGEKSYVCLTCGKRYAQKQSLLSHQKVHAGDAQAIALEAPAKRTLLPQNKQNSKQRIRPKKTYTCHLCHKSFGSSSNLTRHRRVHTGEKLFPCLTCGKRYSFKQHLLSHQKVHTGEKKEMKTLAPEMVIVSAQHDDHNY